MNSLVRAYCIQGNQGKRICTSQDCQSFAILCSDEECQCHSLHADCINSSPLQGFLSKISSQEQEAKKSNRFLIDLLEKSIKQLSVLKHEVEKQSISANSFLKEHQIELINNLRNGDNYRVQGRQMFEMAKSLSMKKKEISTSLNMENKLKAELQPYFESLNSIIEQIAIIIKPQKNPSPLLLKQQSKQKVKESNLNIIKSDLSNIKFQGDLVLSSIMKSSQITFVSPNQVMTNSSQNNFILFEPSIGSIKNDSITLVFEIKQNLHVCLGVVLQKQLSSLGYIWEKAKHVSGYGYLVGYEGRLFSMDQKMNYFKSDDFKGFKDGHIIYLNYEKAQKLMTVTNTSTGEGVRLEIAEDDKDLYFSICLVGSESSAYNPNVLYIGTI